MHKLSSPYILKRLRMGSFLLVLDAGLVLAGALLTARGLVLHSRIDRNMAEEQQIVDWDHEPELWCGLGMLAASPVVYGVQRMLSWGARCPLCMTPPLIHKSCQTNRNARRLFGSHRLRVALSVLFQGRFVCPYCGEPTKCELRNKRGLGRHGNYRPAETGKNPK